MGVTWYVGTRVTASCYQMCLLSQILSASEKSMCLLHETQPHSVLQCVSVHARPPNNI